MNTIEKLIAQHDKTLGRQELKTCKIYRYKRAYYSW